jgi:hypothetical protein
MKIVRDFLMFWYNFIIGDDWTVAVLVSAALVAAWWLIQSGFRPVWWILPIVALASLAFSVWRTAPDVDRPARARKPAGVKAPKGASQRDASEDKEAAAS